MLVASPSSREPSRSRRTLAAKVLVISSHVSALIAWLPVNISNTKWLTLACMKYCSERPPGSRAVRIA